MKKNLKYVLGSTSLLAFAIPVISMVSCGNDSKKDAIYNVALNTIGDCKFTKGDSVTTVGKDYKATIEYKSGCNFISIEVIIANKKVSEPVYSLNNEKTELTIPAKNITGDIRITLTSTSVVKTVNVTLEPAENFKWKTGEKTATSDKDYIATIEYDEGYEFDSIEITIGGNKLDSADFSLNTEKTALTIPANKITGDITIKITAKAK